MDQYVSSKVKTLKVGYSTVSLPGAGVGHTRRALAIRHALERKGLLGKGVDFWLLGYPDDPDAWGKDFIKTGPEIKTDFSKLNNQGVINAFQGIMTETSRAIVAAGLDLLLIDTQIQWANPALSGRLGAKPLESWLVARYAPGLFHELRYPVNRLYQIENFIPENFKENMTLGWARSKNEREGRDARHWTRLHYAEQGLAEWKEGDPLTRKQEPWTGWKLNEQGEQVADPYPDWQARNHKQSRKRLAPVVDVDPARIMTARGARRELCREFGLAYHRPITLVAATFKNMHPEDRERFKAWRESRLKGFGEEENNQQVLTVGRGAEGGAFLPDLYRYLPGVDHYLGNAGYNSVYEVRYLRQLDCFEGTADFFPLTSGVEDQTWRAANIQQVMRIDHEYPVPRGNGADQIATEVGIRAGLLDPAERKW